MFIWSNCDIIQLFYYHNSFNLLYLSNLWEFFRQSRDACTSKSKEYCCYFYRTFVAGRCKTFKTLQNKNDLVFRFRFKKDIVKILIAFALELATFEALCRLIILTQEVIVHQYLNDFYLLCYFRNKKFFL